MTLETLLEELRSLEESLHQSDVRTDRDSLDHVLHSEFLEIGRSGRTYNKREVIESLLADRSESLIWSGDYALRQIAPDTVLLTYQSARTIDSGHREAYTLRASLWVRSQDGWKLFFHQGTPAEQ